MICRLVLEAKEQQTALALQCLANSVPSRGTSAEPCTSALQSVVRAVPLKGDNPELQVGMSPPSPPPTPSPPSISPFIVTLSFSTVYLLFAPPFLGPLFTPTLPFPCFTQMVASCRFKLAVLGFGSSALCQHSSLHSLFSRNILKTLLFFLVLWVYPHFIILLLPF